MYIIPDKLLLLWRHLRLHQTGVTGHDLQLADFLQRHLLVLKGHLSQVESPDIVAVIVVAQIALPRQEGNHHLNAINGWVEIYLLLHITMEYSDSDAI
jgi:hypothetical protein